MLIDYHLHTPLCRHADGAPEEYAARAVERGIAEIGFSDHSPMPAHYDPDWRMALEDLPEYVASVLRAREKFPRLSVKLGLEADYFPGTEDFVYNVTSEYDFDYVIGSVHYIDDWGFDNAENKARFEESDVYDIYAQYFDRVARLAKTRLFDILGHPDVVKKFGHRPDRAYDELMRPALEAVKAAGMALDVNTSGLRFPCREIYPSRRMLEIAREMEIPVTLGADAHRPAHVGEGFGEAVALLRSVGYENLRRYARRTSEPVPMG
ncbi:MAG: histidinol-phosphatase HisJ family protein [Planctomycetes bacterium]|nr:histidinol-phosphatase HisJ family protein [Planctomycetota bacterium]